ncbi:MAG: AraC family transcriptional regulator [Lachnospiraceae bacterium]|nr:AraC family transcriptional regulator [Lachnospiraceae bacterium]
MSEIEIIRYTGIRGIKIFFNTVYRRTPHQHREMELILVLKNEMNIESEHGLFSAGPGSLVVFNPGEIHRLNSSEGCTFLCMQIRPNIFPGCGTENLFFDAQFSFEELKPEEQTVLRHLLLTITEAYFCQEEGFELFCHASAGLLIHKLLTFLPHHFLTAEEREARLIRSERMHRLFSFVEKNYMHKIRLSDFAKEECMSMNYLSHFVRDTIGMTFQEYVAEVRLSAACRMILESPKDRLIDICYAAGFSDYRYFCAAFKKKLKMTPDLYRQTRGYETGEAAGSRSRHSEEEIHGIAESEAYLSLLRKLV